MPRWSSIWTYFDVEELEGTEFMKCKLCGQLYKLVDGSTTGARSHILRKHPELIPALEVRKKKAPASRAVIYRRPAINLSNHRKSAEPRPIRTRNTNAGAGSLNKTNLSQPPAPTRGTRNNQNSPSASSDNAERSIKYQATGVNGDVVTSKILNLILSQNLPFSFVDQEPFKELLKEVAPAYTIPSRNEFLTTHITAALHKEIQQTREHIQASNPLAFAFTSDVWKSKKSDGYIDIHIFFIDKDFKKVHCKLLGVTGLPNPNSVSSSDILEKFQQLLTSYGINATDHELFMTCNSETDVLNMWQDSMFNKIECIGQDLNSVVRKALYTVPEVFHAFESGSRVISYISGVVKQFVREEIGQLPQLIQLLQHVSTQWNSYIFQEEWLRKLQPTIDTVASQHADMPTRTPQESAIAQQCVIVMSPLEQLTKAMNRRYYPSLSMRIPLIEKSKRELTQILQSNSHFHEKSLEFGRMLLGSIDIYLNEQKGNATETWSRAATSLDPRFKTVLFDAATIDHVKKTLVKLHSKIQTLLTPKDDPEGDAMSVDCVQGEWGFLEEKKITPVQPQDHHGPHQTVFEDELQLFWDGGWIGIEQCPLQWWRKHKVRFPFVAELARILLALPASSMSSDHMRSPAGNVVVPKVSSTEPSIKRNMLFARAALCSSDGSIQSSRNFPDVSDDETTDTEE